MTQSIIWRGMVWWVIAVMWGSIASAAVHHTSSHPRQAKSAEIGDSTKQPDTPHQPNPNPPIPPVSPPDQKTNFEAIAAVSIAAIEAARHSTEESKKFYEQYAQLLVWAAGIISLFGTAGGFFYLKSRADSIVEQAASTTTSLLNAKMIQIDSILREKTDAMGAIETNLNNHIITYDEFNKGMRTFQEQVTSDLEAFSIVIPKATELASWITQHATKAMDDPTRVDPQSIARSVLKACDKALQKHPKQNGICAYIYGHAGASHCLLGSFDKACATLSDCLKFDNDNVNTLYNLACCTCLSGRAESRH